uniref:Uncharacterized protein n=1 Tax=Tanacetum cinerariifolium TaxID=118510 RepID=A0A6L2JT48_TANCI|nr:hypothetical protein [Tanacetum cinerariifolium]
MSGQGRGRGCGSYGGGGRGQGQAPSQPHSLGRGNDHQHRPSTMHAPGAQPVALSSCVPVQQQTPMQYCPAQSMPPCHGVGRRQGIQTVAVMPTDAMRNLFIGTSTPVASVLEAVSDGPKPNHLG